jgi:hypothetical protein
MSRWLTCVAALATLAVTAVGPGRATAQLPGRPGPTISPPISPYLNLLRRGNSPGVNYYGLVRPQQQLYNSVNSLQGQVTDNRALISGLAASVDPTRGETGHGTSFLDLGGYFMNMNPAGQGGGGLLPTVGSGPRAGTGGGVAGGAGRPAPPPRRR